MQAIVLGKVIGECSDVVYGDYDVKTFYDFAPASGVKLPEVDFIAVDLTSGEVTTFNEEGDVDLSFDLLGAIKEII